MPASPIDPDSTSTEFLPENDLPHKIPAVPFSNWIIGLAPAEKPAFLCSQPFTQSSLQRAGDSDQGTDPGTVGASTGRLMKDVLSAAAEH